MLGCVPIVISMFVSGCGSNRDSILGHSIDEKTFPPPQ